VRLHAFVAGLENWIISMSNRLNANNRARRFVAAVVASKFAKRSFFSQFARSDLTFNHDFSVGWHFQRDRFTRHKLQRFSTQRAGDCELISAKRNWRWGGHDDLWIGSEHESDGKRLVRRFAALEIEMSVRSGEDTESLVVMNLISIKTYIARFGNRILAHVARQRKIGPAIKLVPNWRWKLGQIHGLPNHHVLLAHSALDDNWRERLASAPVPLRRQLIRFDTERQRITLPRCQQIHGERHRALSGSLEHQTRAAGAQVT